MRIATWNVNSLLARMPRVLPWLGAVQPDVLCLQETKLADSALPVAEFNALGYEVVSHGLGRWNGVAIVSRAGLDDVVRGMPGEPGYPEPEARSVAATCGGLRVWSVYVPNGRKLGDPHMEYKLAWLAHLREMLQRELVAHPRLAVCGDFNVAPHDADVWDPAAFEESTHVTEPERAAINALAGLGLVDVMPRALKGSPFTYWDYRAGCFHKGMGMRIDLTLLSSEVAAAVSDSYIDREARKGTAPSDHAPVVVDIAPPAS